MVPVLRGDEERPRSDPGIKELIGQHCLLRHHGLSTLGLKVPIEALPGDFGWTKGAVSLLPDLKDQCGGYIAVYVINATDRPLEGALYAYRFPFQEVKVDDHWERTQSIESSCGNMGAPEDLEPGYALIRIAPDPAEGDLEGEIRYCFTPASSPPIVSPALPGRFSSKEFEAAGQDVCSNHGLENNISYCAMSGRWESGQFARNPEELIAAIELERSYDKSWATRSAIQRWLSLGPFPGSIPPEFIRALRETLLKPWNKSLDEPSVFARCLGILGGSTPDQSLPYGAPERFHAVAWRYLNQPVRAKNVEWMINPERDQCLKKVSASGNPWGANKAQIEELTFLAETALEEGEPDEREAAAGMLSQKWITSEAFAAARSRISLKSTFEVASVARLRRMLHQGKGEEAGAWLLRHFDLFGNRSPRIWQIASTGTGGFKDWEIPIMLQSIERCPLAGVELVSRRYPGLKDVPVALRENLRRYLLREATRPINLGAPLPSSPEEDKRQIKNAGEDMPYHKLENLRIALQLLASWNNPDDTPLLHLFLTHPAIDCSEDPHDDLQHYPVRETASLLLERRGESVPKGLITTARLYPLDSERK